MRVNNSTHIAIIFWMMCCETKENYCMIWNGLSWNSGQRNAKHKFAWQYSSCLDNFSTETGIDYKINVTKKSIMFVRN